MRLKGSLRHGGGARKGGMTRTDVRRLLVPNAPEPSPEAVAQPSSPRTHGFDALRAAKGRGWAVPARSDGASRGGDGTPPGITPRQCSGRSVERGRRPPRTAKPAISLHIVLRTPAARRRRDSRKSEVGREPRDKRKGGEPKPAPPHVQRQAVSPPRRRPSRSCPSCPARERRCRSASRRPRPRSGAAGSLRSRRPRPDTGWRGCPRS